MLRISAFLKIAILTVSVAIPSLAQSYTITTAAGGAPCCSSGYGGPATKAFITPWGVAVDGVGNLYIAGGQLDKVAPTGIITAQNFSSFGFTFPVGFFSTAVAVDTAANFYIGDNDGRLTVLSGGHATQLQVCSIGVNDIKVDAAGNIYYSCLGGAVKKLDATNGTTSTLYGTSGIVFPDGLAVDGSGNLFVADTLFNIVVKIDGTGKITTVAGSSSPTGGFSGDNGPATKAQLNSPTGIAVDSAGNLYIADSKNNRVRKVDGSGTIITIAGSGSILLSGDGGPGINAGIANPTYIALSNGGLVYVVDDGHSVVRLLTPSGSTGTPSITSGGIVPVYSAVPTVQPGEWVSIYGKNLASSTVTWKGDFPTSLGNTSVTINGKAAYLWFVSPAQINLQVPNDPTTGSVPVVVTTPAGISTSTVTLAQFAPSFSLLDSKHVTGIILRSNGSGAYAGGVYDIIGPTGTSLGYSTVAAKAGDSVELFAVGLGPTNPVVAPGQVYSGAAQTTNTVSLTINNVTVNPTFSGLSSAGLYQINFTVPSGLGASDVSLQATVGGVKTPSGVVISLQ